MSTLSFPTDQVPKVTVGANGTRYVGISGWYIPGPGIPFRAVPASHSETAAISVGQLLMTTTDEADAAEQLSRIAPSVLLSTQTDPPSTQVMAHLASLNYTKPTLLGVAMSNCGPGESGLATPPGSICALRASNAPSDEVGTWMGAGSSPGTAAPYAAADVVLDTSVGLLIGQVVVPLGTASNATGSNLYCGIIVRPR